MRHIKGVGIGVISFVLLFVLIGFFLSDHQVVTREVWLKTTEKQIAPLFEETRNWPSWHAQLFDNNEAEILVEENKLTVLTTDGKKSDLSIDSLGLNYLEIGIVSGAEQPIKAKTMISYPEVDEGTVKLTYSIRYELGNNPIYRFFGLGFDRIMGPEIDQHLKNIQKLVENK